VVDFRGRIHVGLDGRQVDAFNLFMYIRHAHGCSRSTRRTRAFGNSLAANCQYSSPICAAPQDIPISRHHIPVPQPMSKTRFGRLSGANQFLFLNRAFIMTCCMFNRSFSCWTADSQLRTNRHGRDE
jgi:hypothetical protein